MPWWHVWPDLTGVYLNLKRGTKMVTTKKAAAKPVKKPAAQASKKPEKAEKSETAPVEQIGGDAHGKGHG